MLDSSSLKKMGYENHQYQGWIKNIKGVLEELKKEDQQLKRVRVCVWKKSMERVLQNLRIENSIFIRENEKKSKKIQSLSNQIEEIKKENIKISEEIRKVFLLGSPLFDLTYEKYCSGFTRRVSLESGYHSIGSDLSNRSSLDGIEEEKSQSSNKSKLIKKNKLYKTWIHHIEARFGTCADPKLLDLKNLSFQKIELLEKDKEQEKRIYLLENYLIDTKENNLNLTKNKDDLQKASFWNDIHQYQFLNRLDIEEENTHEMQVDLKDLEKDLRTLKEKMIRLNPKIEEFTLSLEKTEKVISLFKSCTYIKSQIKMLTSLKKTIL